MTIFPARTFSYLEKRFWKLMKQCTAKCIHNDWVIIYYLNVEKQILSLNNYSLSYPKICNGSFLDPLYISVSYKKSCLYFSLLSLNELWQSITFLSVKKKVFFLNFLIRQSTSNQSENCFRGNSKTDTCQVYCMTYTVLFFTLN